MEFLLATNDFNTKQSLVLMITITVT